MSKLSSREIPVAITALVGILVIFSYYINIPVVQEMAGEVTGWAVIIGSFAIAFIGPLTLTQYHANVIRKKEDKWIYSLYLLSVTFITYALGILPPMGASTIFTDWYKATQVPLNSTVYSLTAFFICSSAYRAFRFKNFETALLMISGILVMLKNAAIGGYLWAGFPIIGDWIMRIPNTAGFRGIIISSAIGVIAYGIRTLLGYEKLFGGAS